MQKWGHYVVDPSEDVFSKDVAVDNSWAEEWEENFAVVHGEEQEDMMNGVVNMTDVFSVACEHNFVIVQ